MLAVAGTPPPRPQWLTTVVELVFDLPRHHVTAATFPRRSSREAPYPRAQALDVDKKSALASPAQIITEALDELSGDERNAIYRILRLEMIQLPEGLQVSGVLLPSRTQSYGWALEAKNGGLRFRALLDGSEVGFSPTHYA